MELKRDVSDWINPGLAAVSLPASIGLEESVASSSAGLLVSAGRFERESRFHQLPGTKSMSRDRLA